MTELTQLVPAKPSNFDAHKPPEKELIEDCVHCGFCLPACPTYVLWGEEMDSPRGRIHLAQGLLDGDPLSATAGGHFDACLGCLSCVSACPSDVDYATIIETTRAEIDSSYARS